MNLKFVVTALLSIFLLSACGSTEVQKFTEIEDAFFSQYFRLNPIHATTAGIHSYDTSLTDFSEEGFQQRTDLYVNTLDEIQRIKSRKLKRHRQIDQELFEQVIKQQLFLADTLQEQIWNPILHIRLAERAYMDIADKPFANDSIRAEMLMERFSLLPAWLTNRLDQLEDPARIFILGAMADARQSAEVLSDSSFLSYFPELNDTLSAELMEASETAAQAFADYADQLETNILPGASTEFQLGSEIYSTAIERILQTEWTYQNIRERAEMRIQQVRDSMYVPAADLAEEWFDYRYQSPSANQRRRTINRVMDEITANREIPENILNYMSSEIAQLRNFVENRDLITLNPNKQLQLRTLPMFLAEPNGIHLNNPGPLDNHLPAYLDLPLSKDTTLVNAVTLNPDKFNQQQLQIMAIYEAVPGKFVQHYYSNRYPSLIRTVFPNPSLTDGWAHYAERMMIENAWAAENPQLKLIQQKREIAEAMIAVLSYQVHTENLGESEVVQRLINEAYMTRTEAEGVWTQIQLSPFTISAAFIGKELILDARENFREQRGTNFELLEFHKLLLSYGSPPIHYLNNLLLEATF